MAVRELVRGWKHDPDTVSILKTLAQDSKDWQVRDIAVEELAWGWKDDSNTLSGSPGARVINFINKFDEIL